MGVGGTKIPIKNKHKQLKTFLLGLDPPILYPESFPKTRPPEAVWSPAVSWSRVPRTDRPRFSSSKGLKITQPLGGPQGGG